MDEKNLAEQELKDLIAKYPNLQLDVAIGVTGMSFSERKAVPVETEVVAPSEQVETPVIDATTVDPVNPQPATNETVETA